MKIFILTEAGNNIGFGHLARCLSLYEGFRRYGITAKLLVNSDTHVRKFLKIKNYEILNWLAERKKVYRLLKDADVAIIDSYLANETFYKEVSEMTKTSIYIDDNKRINYPKGIVVNGNIYANKLKYPKKEGVLYLRGCKYTLLRKEFWMVRERKINKDIKRLFITFGGEDIRNITPKILNLLDKENPELIKDVVIGGGFRNIEELRSLKSKSKTINLIYYPDARLMKKVMLRSDIAICSGGQTLYELARIGTPTIAMAVTKNQINNIRFLSRVGFIEDLGWWKDKKIPHKLIQNINLLKDKALRIKKSRIGMRIVDGKGAERACNFILKERERYGAEAQN